jgi:hypothetical protein
LDWWKAAASAPEADAGSAEDERRGHGLRWYLAQPDLAVAFSRRERSGYGPSTEAGSASPEPLWPMPAVKAS